MQMTVHGKTAPACANHKKMVRGFLLFFCLLLTYSASAQNLSLSLKKVSLEKAFREIEAKVPQRFVYTREMMDQSKPVSLSINNAPLKEVLQKIFEQQPLDYALDENFIKVRLKVSVANTTKRIDVNGKVTNTEGLPVSSITVTAKESGAMTATDNDGGFVLHNIVANDILILSGIGYMEKTVMLAGRTNVTVQLEVRYTSMDETVIMAYGTTTKRLNTGNISKVTAEEIGKQPVSNALAALQGRAPGLIINQTNGYGGGSIEVQLRGQSSILQGTQPFFVIDGIPFAPQNNRINQLTNASITGVSPFYTINPVDIESIEILKDADATAIYGSRGANGVILITTKKGQAGKTKLTANSYTSWSRVTRTMDMLNTEQYVAMRKEAYANDGITPSGPEAADILLWDTERYTDMKKLFLGNTARSYDANLSLSGGSANTQFLINGGYHRETTVLPTSLFDYRTSIHSAFNHASNNKKLTLNLKWDYSFTRNSLPGIDPTQFINRAPNMKLYDDAGKLNWEEGGTSFSSTGFSEFSNPLASLETRYVGKYQNFGNALSLHYNILPYLVAHASGGFNRLTGDEVRTNPSPSLDPFDANQRPQSFFGKSDNKTWIVEPQLEFKKSTGIGKINLLAGGSLQHNSRNGVSIIASNYSSDLLLNSVSGAANVLTSNSFNEYRYNAIFARFNYNKDDKYIINLSGRRDGSSRFGPDKQFSNFGAAGAAWIFSSEPVLKKSLPWLSFGKIRGSYGTAGNDAIGDYQFLDTWNTNASTYQGVATLLPGALFNSELAWELNKKLEGAIDLGFFDQRILVSACYYKNRSGNQLVQYNLPIQTGFASISKNLDAIVENAGYEFSFQYRNRNENPFKWVLDANLTTSTNKLVRFPGLASSSYASRFVEGEPLSVQRLYQYTGIEATTGLYTLLDVDRNGTLNVTDRIVLKNRQPRLYGGLGNSFSYKNFELSLFFQFVKQEGLNYLNTIGSFAPGNPFINQPKVALNRWQKPGDVTDVQKFTTQYVDALSYLITSDAIYSDASFIRCKNVSLSYTLPKKLLHKLRSDGVQLYVRGQNIFTITNYPGADPENQNIYRMPPLRTIAAGIQFSL